MERLLADASKIAGVEFDISSYSDVIEAIHVMQEEMGIAGATQEEAAGTISGSLSMLSASWENFLTAIGDGGRTMDLSAVTENLLNSLGAVAANVGPALLRIGQAIAVQLPPIIAEAMAGIPAYIQEQVTAAFGADAGSMLGGFFAQFEGIGAQLQQVFGNIMSTVQQIASSLVPLIQPVVTTIGNVVGNAASVILTALTGITSFIADNIAPTVTAILDTVVPVLSEIITAVGEFAVMVENFIGEAFGGILALAQEVWPDISAAIMAVVDTVGPAVGTVFNFIKDVATTAFNAVRSVVQAVWPTVSNIISTAVNAAKTVVTTAVNVIKGAFNGIKTIVNNVKTAFNNIKNAITAPIEKAKEIVGGAIDFIKSIFPVDLGKILNLKIPHINVDGGEPPWGIGGAGRLPSFNIVWKGAGGMVDGATLIGAGERGAELIWPSYEPYIGKYARAIADNMPNSGVTVNFTYNGREDASGAVKLLTANLRQLKATGAI